MQTISTKYLGSTNRKGPRMTAITSSGIRIYRAYDHETDREENHMRIARTIKDEMNWTGAMEGGDTKDGMVFVFSGHYTI